LARGKEVSGVKISTSILQKDAKPGISKPQK
jgi:hypothetical protein